MTPLIAPLLVLAQKTDPLTSSTGTSIVEVGIGGIFVLLVLDFVLRIIAAANKPGGKSAAGAGQEAKQTVTVNAEKPGNPGNGIRETVLRIDGRTETHHREFAPLPETVRRIDVRTEAQSKCMAEIGASLKNIEAAAAQTNTLLQDNLNRLTDLALRAREEGGG